MYIYNYIHWKNMEELRFLHMGLPCKCLGQTVLLQLYLGCTMLHGGAVRGTCDTSFPWLRFLHLQGAKRLN